MNISVEIKTKCDGKFCSRNCKFFRSGVISDWCYIYDILTRVDGDKLRFISYRHNDCLSSTIS